MTPRTGRPSSDIRSGSSLLDFLINEVNHRGINMAEASSDMGLYQNAIRNWRAGKNKPSIHNVEVLARYLGYQLSLEKIDGFETENGDEESAECSDDGTIRTGQLDSGGPDGRRQDGSNDDSYSGANS